MNEHGNAQSVIHWTSLVRKHSTKFLYSNFIYRVLCLLNSEVEPRIGSDIEKLLHFSDQSQVGDWYLYQNY